MYVDVPAQHVHLQPVHDGRLMGDITIAGMSMRIEAFELRSQDPTTNALVDDLYRLAECGGPLAVVDGYLLTVMPKGGSV